MPSGSVIGSNLNIDKIDSYKFILLLIYNQILYLSTWGFRGGITHKDSPVNLFQKYGRFSRLLQNFFHPCCWSSGESSDSGNVPGGVPYNWIIN